MATVSELARDILGSASSSAGVPIVAKWVDNRYREMVSRVKFRHLRQVGELSLPALTEEGTVAVNRGSTAVSGSSTVFETTMGTGTQEYWFFRTKSNWYEISSVTDETNLVLKSAFAEESVTTGSYKIVKRYHPFESTARWFGTFHFQRLYYELESISHAEMDIRFPGRIIAGHYPTHIAQVGLDSNDYLMCEIYPPPKTTELIQYTYWTLPSTLSITSTIPPVIDAYTLKEGVLIDFYRFEKLESIRNGNVEAAAVFGNWEARQGSKWEKVIKDAIRTSRGVDDITLLLDWFKGSGPRAYEQRTAHDYVYDNWSRP